MKLTYTDTATNESWDIPCDDLDANGPARLVIQTIFACRESGLTYELDEGQRRSLLFNRNNKLIGTFTLENGND